MNKVIIQKITTGCILFLLLISFGNMQAQNVGIGTPTPDYTLDVNGTVGINDYVYHNDDSNSDSYFGFPADDQWELILGGRKVLFGDGVSNKVIVNPDQSNTSFQVVGDLYDHLLYTDPVNDHVGIGLSTPSYLFDVGGEFRVVGDLYDHLLYVDAPNDRIGVGMDTPAYLMDVDGEFRVVGDLYDHLLYVDGENDHIGVGMATPTYLFDVDGEFRVVGDLYDHLLYVDGENDKVGVGMSAPQYFLDVDGDFRIHGNNKEHLLFVDHDNDRVGFGTANPQYDVDIQGTLNVTKLKLAGSPVIRQMTFGEVGVPGGIGPQTVTTVFTDSFTATPHIIATYRTSNGVKPVILHVLNSNANFVQFQLFPADGGEVPSGLIDYMAISKF